VAPRGQAPMRPEVDERPLTPWGPSGCGAPKVAPRGWGSQAHGVRGRARRRVLPTFRVQRAERMGAGVVCSMTPSESLGGGGALPQGGPPSRGSRPWGVRAERAEARAATPRRPAGDAGRLVIREPRG
jgi:hypothetical protein